MAQGPPIPGTSALSTAPGPGTSPPGHRGARWLGRGVEAPGSTQPGVQGSGRGCQNPAFCNKATDTVLPALA